MLLTNDCIACVGRDKECSFLLCAPARPACVISSDKSCVLYYTLRFSKVVVADCAEKQPRLRITMSSATDEMNSRWILFVCDGSDMLLSADISALFSALVLLLFVASGCAITMNLLCQIQMQHARRMFTGLQQTERLIHFIYNNICYCYSE